MSLGGARSKLILAWFDGAWRQPIDGAPSTHILKPEPPRLPELAAAEAWALRLAGRTARRTVGRRRHGARSHPHATCLEEGFAVIVRRSRAG